MSQETFAVKDSVVFTDERLEAKHGNGPFPVVAVEDVPLGLAKRHDHPHDYGGRYQYSPPRTIRQNVGHNQWVSVETPEGVEQFSGVLLKKVV